MKGSCVNTDEYKAYSSLDLLRNYQQNVPFNQIDSSGHGITTKSSFHRILKLTRSHDYKMFQLKHPTLPEGLQTFVDLGYEHHTVNHGSKEYARDDIHTNNCECRTALLRLWLSKHMGINKYNLNLYVKTFQFLHNHRNLDDYSKFIKIISVVYLATKFYIKSE